MLYLSESANAPARRELGEAVELSDWWVVEPRDDPDRLALEVESLLKADRRVLRIDLDKVTVEEVHKDEGKFVVRHFDGFDNDWIDVSEPVSKAEAQRIWNEKTANGTENTKYADIDYYRVFEADTTMVLSEQGRRDRGEG